MAARAKLGLCSPTPEGRVACSQEGKRVAGLGIARELRCSRHCTSGRRMKHANGWSPPLMGCLPPMASRIVGWLLVLACASHLAAENNALAGDCGRASNCGGLGGWRVLLLVDVPDRDPGQDTEVTGAPDLAVDAPDTDDAMPTVGAEIVLRVTVRNHGDADAEATSLRWLRSADAIVGDGDFVEGTASVASLAAGSGVDASVTVTVPTEAGTYWYGACVDAVRGEPATGDNCSPGTRIAVAADDGGEGPRFGALATDFSVSASCPGLAAGIVGRPPDGEGGAGRRGQGVPQRRRCCRVRCRRRVIPYMRGVGLRRGGPRLYDLRVYRCFARCRRRCRVAGLPRRRQHGVPDLGEQQRTPDLRLQCPARRRGCECARP